jgi:hypothetical protein
MAGENQCATSGRSGVWGVTAPTIKFDSDDGPTILAKRGVQHRLEKGRDYLLWNQSYTMAVDEYIA